MIIKKASTLIGLDLGYFVGGGFWLALSTILTGIGGLVLSSLFSRIWPPDVYGQFSFLMSAIAFMSVAALPGMGQAITQAVSEGKDGMFVHAIGKVARWSLFGAFALILGSIYFYFRDNSSLAVATLLCALAFPISASGSFFGSYLNGRKDFRNMSIFIIASQYSSMIATSFALLYLPTLIWVSFFSAWSTALINIILTFILLGKIKKRNNDVELIKLGKTLSFSQFFSFSADFLDKFLVPLLLGFSSNAIYAFSVLIPNQIHTFLKNITSLSQPKIADLSEKQLKVDLLRKAILLEIVILFVVITYIFISPWIFEYVYPKYKDNALIPSQIFSVSLLYFPSNLFGLAIIKKRRPDFLNIINIFYVLTTLLTLIIFLPFLGILGAVLSKIISRAILSASHYYYFRKSYK